MVDDPWPALPKDLTLARTTRTFTEKSVPDGLLQSHQIAAGVWGQIVVEDGSIDFAFEDALDHRRYLEAGDNLVIPPQRLHRVILTGPVRFLIEFYRTDDIL